MPDTATLNPAELSDSDFQKFLDAAKTTGQRQEGVTFPPDTQAAIDRSTASIPRVDASKYIGPEAARMGARPEAFLDISTGAPAGVRAKLGLDENRLNQFKVLAKRYGAENVDLSPEGRFIIRNQGDNGKTDLMVDPIGADTGDVAQIGSQALPIGAAVAGAWLGGKATKNPIGRVLTASTGGAVAGELTGAAQDTLVRLYRGDEAGLPEIAKQRAKQALADEVFGVLAAGGAKVMSKTMETVLGAIGIPMGESAGRTAAEALKARTGVGYKLTPGQESGSKILLRGESNAAARPGSASAMDMMAQDQKSAEDELKRIFMGLPRDLSDENLAKLLPRSDETGSRALRKLGMVAQGLESDVEQARGIVNRTGTTEAQIAADIDLSNPLISADVGRAVRDRATGEFAQGRADFSQRYITFLEKPEIQARTVAGNDLATGAKKVEKDFVPAAERTVKQPAYDTYGSPTEKEVQQTDVLNKFVEGKFRGFLDELKGLGGAKVSVNDLKRIRTSIDNSIKEGVAIPGTDVAQLESLRGVVDDGITKALSDMPDKSLLTDWNALRKDYSDFQGRFNRTGIRDILIPEGERGSIGNTALAESITGNSPQAADRYNDLKTFLGPTSPEFKQLQQLTKEKALLGSLRTGADGGYIEGAGLENRLANIRPEIAQELFGLSRNRLDEIASVLRKTQGKLDVQELVNATRGRTLTAQTVQDLLDTEEARATAFNNRLIKAASKGTLGAERIDPRDFVRYATQMPENEAMKVMNGLHDAADPSLVRDVKQLAIEDLWERVQAGSPNRKLTSSTLVDQAMGDEAQQRTWRAILGDNTVDGLKELAEVVRNRDFSAASYKGAGNLGASSDVNKIFMKPEVGIAKEVASRFLVGFLYAGPLKRMVTNLANNSDQGRLLNAVVASTPFVEEVAKRFGPDAPTVMAALREQIEPVQRKELFIQGKVRDGVDPSELSLPEFKQWLQNNVKQ